MVSITGLPSTPIKARFYSKQPRLLKAFNYLLNAFVVFQANDFGDVFMTRIAATRLICVISQND